MKVITVFIAAGLVLAIDAQSTSTDNTTRSKPKKVNKAPDPVTIPKDATPLPDGSYRYVDKDGKKWIYRATPFGVSKAEERPAPPVPKVEDDPTKSEDLGDSVRFTRPTPFGPKVWTTRKSQLDAFEKTIFDRDNDKKNNAAPADASKHDDTANPGGDTKSRDAARQATK